MPAGVVADVERGRQLHQRQHRADETSSPEKANDASQKFQRRQTATQTKI